MSVHECMHAYTSCNYAAWKNLRIFDIPPCGYPHDERKKTLLENFLKKTIDSQTKYPAAGQKYYVTTEAQATLPPDEHKAVRWEGGRQSKEQERPKGSTAKRDAFREFRDDNGKFLQLQLQLQHCNYNNINHSCSFNYTTIQLQLQLQLQLHYTTLHFTTLPHYTATTTTIATTTTTTTSATATTTTCTTTTTTTPQYTCNCNCNYK